MNIMEEVYGHGQDACVLGQCFKEQLCLKSSYTLVIQFNQIIASNKSAIYNILKYTVTYAPVLGKTTG